MCACTPLPGEGDAPGGYVIVFDDITALLQAQRDAAWGEVARRLAHEIKNPLTPIQLSAERMRRKLMPSHEREGRADARRAHLHDRAAGRGDEGDGERVQRVRARAAASRWRRFDLNALVTEVTDLYRAQARAAGVRLKVDLDPALDHVGPTRAALRQMLHNLLTNAVEALEGQPDGEIAVATRLASRAADRRGRRDHGRGQRARVPARLIGQVFDPYVTRRRRAPVWGSPS